MKIVLIGPIAVNAREKIEALLEREHEILCLKDEKDAARYGELLAQADAIVGWPLSAEVVALARKVRLIQVMGAGVDGVPFDLIPSGAVVANTYHHEPAIAEHVLMAILVLWRRPHLYDESLRRGEWLHSCIWGEAPQLDVLAGRMLLVIGVGRIGRAVARLAKAFQMRVVGVTDHASEDAGAFDQLVPYNSLHQELPAADFVVVCCALRPSTRGLINSDVLARMKPSAFLINVARGPVVDERALFEALSQRRIAGAAIDVWYQYPTDPAQPCWPSRYPFHELPNVLMTPHISGWSRCTLEGRIRDVAENLNRLAAGRPLLNVVYPPGAKPGN